MIMLPLALAMSYPRSVDHMAVILLTSITKNKRWLNNQKDSTNIKDHIQYFKHPTSSME